MIASGSHSGFGFHPGGGVRPAARGADAEADVVAGVAGITGGASEGCGAVVVVADGGGAIGPLPAVDPD